MVPFQIGGLVLQGERVWYWAVGALLLLAVWLALNQSGPRGTGGTPCTIPGRRRGGRINAADHKVMVFVISAVFASIAGSLAALLWFHHAGQSHLPALDRTGHHGSCSAA